MACLHNQSNGSAMVFPRPIRPPLNRGGRCISIGSAPGRNRFHGAETTMKTVILVHGCHLGAYDWRGIAWGHAGKQQLGRIPRAVLSVLHDKAELMVFGTGASQKSVDMNGTSVMKREGEYTRDYMLGHFEDL